MPQAANTRAARLKARRRKKIRQQLILLLVLLALLIFMCFVVVQLLRRQMGVSDPASPDAGPNAGPGVSADVPDPGPDTRVLLDSLPLLDEGQLDENLWNTSQPVERTINFEVYSPDYRLVAVPESDMVSMSHFSTVTFMGDSITQGLAIYETGFPNAHYCAYKNAGASSVVNRSTLTNVNGNQEVAIDALVASQPDAVYVMFGMNNLNGDGVENSYFNYYAAMLDLLRASLHPSVQIYVETMTPTTAETGARRPNLSSSYLIFINNQLSKLATERGCYFIDIYECLLDETGNMNPAFAASDGIHMNPDGYARWVAYARTHVVHSHWAKYEGENPYEIY